MAHIFFDNWATLLRTFVIGVLAYTSLLGLLRLSGKRTLSKMNAFDLIVTVALGSTLATILLNKDVVLAQGIVAFALLVGLQFVITWSSVRAPWVRRLVTGEPTLLLYRGGVPPGGTAKNPGGRRGDLGSGSRLPGCLRWGTPQPWSWRRMAHSAWSSRAMEPGRRV